MSEATYTAIDAADVRVGDRVIVQDVDSDDEAVRGEVQRVTCEWGRYGHTIEREDGVSVTVWERTGRTWTQVEAEA